MPNPAIPTALDLRDLATPADRLRAVDCRSDCGGISSLPARPVDGRHAAARHPVRRRRRRGLGGRLPPGDAGRPRSATSPATTCSSSLAARLERRRSEILVGLVAYLFTCALIIGFGEAMRRGADARQPSGASCCASRWRSIGDAVITTDVDGPRHLHERRRRVADRLDASARPLGQPLDTVFRIVNEQRRQPVENPAARALRDGRRRRAGQPHRADRQGRHRAPDRRQRRADQGRARPGLGVRAHLPRRHARSAASSATRRPAADRAPARVDRRVVRRRDRQQVARRRHPELERRGRAPVRLHGRAGHRTAHLAGHSARTASPKKTTSSPA